MMEIADMEQSQCLPYIINIVEHCVTAARTRVPRPLFAPQLRPFLLDPFWEHQHVPPSPPFFHEHRELERKGCCIRAIAVVCYNHRNGTSL